MTKSKIILSKEEFQENRRILCSKCSTSFIPESRRNKTCSICIEDLKKIEHHKKQIRDRRSKNTYKMSDKVLLSKSEIKEKKQKRLKDEN